MTVDIPRSLVEFILLGPQDDRRQLQDSPILGDVWVEFAKRPADAIDLLITPHKERGAAAVAAALARHEGIKGADLAHLQGIIAAKLSFAFVLRFVVPMSQWWKGKRVAAAFARYMTGPKVMETDIAEVLGEANKWLNKKGDKPIQDIETAKRFVTLAGLLLWAEGKARSKKYERLTIEERLRWILDKATAKELTDLLKESLGPADQKPDKGYVWTISLNRKASPALEKSVPAVKADAARTLFKVDCRKIVWAVIDSGIDGTHSAFGDRAAKLSRVKKSFDFTTIRKIVSYDNLLDAKTLKKTVAEIVRRGSMYDLTAKKVAAALTKLAQGTRDGLPVDWETVGSIVEIEPSQRPGSHHGTHVAGILGASKGVDSPSESSTEDGPLDGMCPDIGLYDFRVLAPTLQETEFAIIAAMQYIRYINERNSYMTVHGVNLSLSIPHDVRNYACGRTPVCNECERLVNSGVVVVAAAGNRGYQNFETREGLYESYAAFSITDPGNAEGVITVGATHRSWPHTNGVSFFSSRGPTGDGRMKPDLVAPGERIRAPLLGEDWGELDGTSMAAPHVSGAAAMLMARYTELIGQPRRIKQILCTSATDLGRERSFQGHGMLDVLRAFQSI